MRALICGGGVVGAAIAYFLSRRRVETVVIERAGVACAASGKSGGFLARDWCDGTALGPLAWRSFDLHADLAATLDADYGYRRLDTVGIAARTHGSPGVHRADSIHRAPDWLSESTAVHGQLGTTETTAQVDPARFTHALVDAAAGHGTRTHRAA